MVDKGDIKQLREKKLSICFVAPVPPPYGGIANWTSMVCQYLERKYAESIQYTVLNTAPNQRVTEGRSLWNRIVGGGLDMLRQRRNLKKLLDAHSINVIHMTTSGSLSVIRDLILSRVAKQYKVPVVYHIHFGRIPEIQKKDSLEWKVIQAVLKNVERVIAIDKKTYDVLYSIYGQKICYVPNPIDVEDMPEREKHPEKVIMYLGWVIKEKGIEELLEAWEKVYRTHDDWKLRIIGPYDEGYYEYLTGKYDTNGVEFLGEQPHATAMQMLNKASIFVLPSHTEGCPYVIMEAMALGKAIIGTNVGNIPEMLSDGCGCVVKKYDIEGLIKALLYLWDSDHNRYGHNACAKVRVQYSIDVIVEKYKSIWMHR